MNLSPVTSSKVKEGKRLSNTCLSFAVNVAKFILTFDTHTVIMEPESVAVFFTRQMISSPFISKTLRLIKHKREIIIRLWNSTCTDQSMDPHDMTKFTSSQTDDVSWPVKRCCPRNMVSPFLTICSKDGVKNMCRLLLIERQAVITKCTTDLR